MAETQAVAGMPGRYATALFELAQESGAVEAVEADLDGFDRLLDESSDLRRLVRSPVFSAQQLKPEQVEAIKSELRAAQGRDVKLTQRVDASILGGLIVRIGSRMIDNSIRTKLQNLKLAMKGIG